MRSILFFLLAEALCLSALVAQDSCELQLYGRVVDQETSQPLSYAILYHQDPYVEAQADSLGFFALESLCPGEYHFEISHLGCEDMHLVIDLQRDTQITIRLEHYHELLQEVTVSEDASRGSRSVQSTIGTARLRQARSADLANVVRELPGVRAITNGSGISKPMIHGQYGNRVGIIQDGVQHASQQWGVSHAPEIDPQFGNRISIVKGAGALEYSGRNVAHLVIVDPGALPDDDELAGEASYQYQHNGRRHTLQSRLERKEKFFAWQWYGSYNNGGDQHTPDYLLRNTGMRQITSSLRLGKELNKKQGKLAASYSYFYSNVGLLRGSNISNLTDLERALVREVPFFTTDTFARSIESPRYEVSHHLAKVEYNWNPKPEVHKSLLYSAQLNRRDEFDVRRGGRSDRAALSLQKWTHDIKFVHTQTREDFNWKGGFNFRLEDNENVPGTGILPLIPQYRSLRPAGFMAFLWDRGESQYEIGGRYSFVYTDVREIQTVPLAIIKTLHRFQEFALTTEGRWELHDRVEQKLNLSFFQRAPEINELHSRGVHQSVSGIEEGDPELHPERILKLIAETRVGLRPNLYVTLTPHFSYIQDYIYLDPQEVLRLTIRGAFPVFEYSHDDALFYGGDSRVVFEPLLGLKAIAGLSILRSYNLREENTIVFTPGDRATVHLEYNTIDLPFGKKHTFALNYLYQWEQTRIEPEQDFSPVPAGYNLWGLSWTGSFATSIGEWEASIRIDNLMDTMYRDYLNRQRYFSDEMGRQIGVSLRYRLVH